MNIQLVTPAPLKLNNGNKITALRWVGIFKKLGHQVRLTQSYDGDQLRRSDCAPCAPQRRLHQPLSRTTSALPLIVVLTGTDVYRDIHHDQKSQQSLEYASRLVVLQKRALSEIPRRLQRKTRVIYQSAESVSARRPRRNGALMFASSATCAPKKIRFAPRWRCAICR